MDRTDVYYARQHRTFVPRVLVSILMLGMGIHAAITGTWREGTEPWFVVVWIGVVIWVGVATVKAPHRVRVFVDGTVELRAISGRRHVRAQDIVAVHITRGLGRTSLKLDLRSGPLTLGQIERPLELVERLQQLNPDVRTFPH